MKRARIALISSGIFIGGGFVFFVAGWVEEDSCAGYAPSDCEPSPEGVPLIITGGVLMTAGLAGVIASAVLRRKREGERRRLWDASYETPRRVQWDLARSRLVF